MWDNLSLSAKSELMKFFIEKKIYDVKQMKEMYNNSMADGGDMGNGVVDDVYPAEPEVATPQHEYVPDPEDMEFGQMLMEAQMDRAAEIRDGMINKFKDGGKVFRGSLGHSNAKKYIFKPGSEYDDKRIVVDNMPKQKIDIATKKILEEGKKSRELAAAQQIQQGTLRELTPEESVQMDKYSSMEAARNQYDKNGNLTYLSQLLRNGDNIANGVVNLWENMVLPAAYFNPSTFGYAAGYDIGKSVFDKDYANAALIAGLSFLPGGSKTVMASKDYLAKQLHRPLSEAGQYIREKYVIPKVKEYLKNLPLTSERISSNKNPLNRPSLINYLAKNLPYTNREIRFIERVTNPKYELRDNIFDYINFNTSQLTDRDRIKKALEEGVRKIDEKYSKHYGFKVRDKYKKQWNSEFEKLYNAGPEYLYFSAKKKLDPFDIETFKKFEKLQNRGTRSYVSETGEPIEEALTNAGVEGKKGGNHFGIPGALYISNNREISNRFARSIYDSNSVGYIGDIDFGINRGFIYDPIDMSKNVHELKNDIFDSRIGGSTEHFIPKDFYKHFTGIKGDYFGNKALELALFGPYGKSAKVTEASNIRKIVNKNKRTDRWNDVKKIDDNYFMDSYPSNTDESVDLYLNNMVHLPRFTNKKVEFARNQLNRYTDKKEWFPFLLIDYSKNNKINFKNHDEANYLIGDNYDFFIKYANGGHINSKGREDYNRSWVDFMNGSLMDKNLPSSEEFYLRQTQAESGFNNIAVSGAGARGINQITDISRRDYNENNHTRYTAEDLNNPEINNIIRMNDMEHYLNADWNKKIQSKTNKLLKAAIAYNQGQSKTIKMLEGLKSRGYDIYDGIEWLKEVPKESRDYAEFIVFGKNTGGPRNTDDYNKAISNNKDIVDMIKRDIDVVPFASLRHKKLNQGKIKYDDGGFMGGVEPPYNFYNQKELDNIKKELQDNIKKYRDELDKERKEEIRINYDIDPYRSGASVASFIAALDPDPISSAVLSAPDAIYDLIDFIKNPTWGNAGHIALDALNLVPIVGAAVKLRRLNKLRKLNTISGKVLPNPFFQRTPMSRIWLQSPSMFDDAAQAVGVDLLENKQNK